MGKYLDIIRRSESKGRYDRNDKYDKLYTKGCAHGHDTNRQDLIGRIGRIGRTCKSLEECRPDYIDVADWQQAVEDGRQFLARWGEQAGALGWTARDLFGLAPVPDRPAPSYRRLSRYDQTGLIWLLRGRQVVAITATTAAVRGPTGSNTVYPRFDKPAFGPLGDSLDDLDPG